MGYYKNTEQSPSKRIASYHARLYTCHSRVRSKVLKEQAAMFVDVTPGHGEPEFSVAPDVWLRYVDEQPPPEGNTTWVEFFRLYYGKLQARFPTNWLRVLHNQNIVFTCRGLKEDYDRVGCFLPRRMAAMSVTEVFKEHGYMVLLEDDLKKP